MTETTDQDPIAYVAGPFRTNRAMRRAQKASARKPGSPRDWAPMTRRQIIDQLKFDRQQARVAAPAVVTEVAA